MAETHSPAVTAPAPLPRTRRRRIILLMTLAVTAPLVAVVGYFVLQAHWSAQALAAAIAEADQLDPGWRLMELEANRKPVPAEKDSAPIVSRMGTPLSRSATRAPPARICTNSTR